MGSGKGRTRRAQSMGIFNPITKNQSEQWETFVHENGIADLGLYEYYLGKTPLIRTPANYEKILTELFSDLVAIGIIALPKSCEASDFSLRPILPSMEKIEACYKNNPNLKEEFRFAVHYTLPDGMSMRETSQAAHIIHDGMQGLLERIREEQPFYSR